MHRSTCQRALDLELSSAGFGLELSRSAITLQSGSAASQSFRFQTAPSPRQRGVDGGQERSEAGIDKRRSDAH